jgi:putative ABC transport system permease protein
MMKGFSWLDLKLGLRMLVKYPWLTVVGGLGMAVAVAIGAGFFGFIYSMMDPTVPLPNGNRIVTIQVWSDSSRSPQRRILHDFFFWRDKVTTMEEVGAFYPAWRNLITPYGDPDPIPVAEMTASGFRVAGVAPIAGRHLRESDEAKNAEPVAVIGEEIWRERYAEDPAILNRTIQAGTKTYRIVGVMPKDFGWPLHHEVWVPLQMQPSEFEPRTGPIIHAFGRLKPGVSIADAQTELAAIGKQMSASNPQTHAQLRPTVLPYTYPFVDVDSIQMSWAFHALQVAITLLLVLVCANVATLIYARTATRQGEITVRAALGASRARIVGQLFAEALVLAAVASVAGIVLAKVALAQVNEFLKESLATEVPFWMRPQVSMGVVFYVVVITLLGAAIVGAIPALKATGSRVQSRLRQLGGGSGLLLGKTWTVLIVAQVAFAVMILPTTINYTWEMGQAGIKPAPFADNYLTAQLYQEDQFAEDEQAAAESRRLFVQRQAELIALLRNDPAVASATFAWREPGEESTGMIEIEGIPLPTEPVSISSVIGTRHGYPVKTNHVDSMFFNTFGISLLRGRTFNPGDHQARSRAAVVNQAFAANFLEGQNAVGRRFRFVGRGFDSDSLNMPLGGWYEIVGVVSNFPASESTPRDPTARAYLPPAPSGIYRYVLLRVRGGSRPAAFAGKFKRIAMSVDPTLQLNQVRSLKDALTEQQGLLRMSAIALITLTISVLLLSAAGIYSLMSLAINHRRREIGIRSAIGGYPRNILAAVFKRATRQLAAGVFLGAAAALAIDRFSMGLSTAGRGLSLVPLVALIMATVGLLAAIGPARRGLRIQPTEALREL